MCAPMDVVALLRETRAALPDCESLVFGDLSTGTVLCAAAAEGAALQERHNALLAEMAGLLDLLEVTDGRARAVMMVPGETRVGVALAEGEALVARWAPASAAEAVVALDTLADRMDPPA